MTSIRSLAQSVLRFGRSAATSSAERCCLAWVACTLLASGCDAHPESDVVFDNRYPASAASALVVYRAYWQSVTFVDPVPPGASSDPKPVVPASGNTAYVVLAPAWNPKSQKAPTSFVVMRSRRPYEVALDDVLRIPVDDTTFAGNCASGSRLTQEQADFVTQRVFATEFAPFSYDPATCTATPIGDAGDAALDDAGGDSGVDSGG